MSKINKGMEVSKHITLETIMVVKIHLTYIPFINFHYCFELTKKHVMQLGKFEHLLNLNNEYYTLCLSIRITSKCHFSPRIPKLGFLLSPNFECSYFSQIKLVLRIRRKYLITLKRSFQ